MKHKSLGMGEEHPQAWLKAEFKREKNEKKRENPKLHRGENKLGLLRGYTDLSGWKEGDQAGFRSAGELGWDKTVRPAEGRG